MPRQRHARVADLVEQSRQGMFKEIVFFDDEETLRKINKPVLINAILASGIILQVDGAAEMGVPEWEDTVRHMLKADLIQLIWEIRDAEEVQQPIVPGSNPLWDRAVKVWQNVHLNMPGFRLDLRDDDGVYFQVVYDRPDANTGVMGEGRGGKGQLRHSMSDSEMVRMAFGLFLAYLKHEGHEAFLYKRHRVYDPHHDIDVMVGVTPEVSTEALVT